MFRSFSPIIEPRCGHCLLIQLSLSRARARSLSLALFLAPSLSPSLVLSLVLSLALSLALFLIKNTNTHCSRHPAVTQASGHAGFRSLMHAKVTEQSVGECV